MKKIFTLCLLVLILSCSDKENSTIEPKITKYLKNVKYLDKDFEHLNHSFSYKGSFLNQYIDGNFSTVGGGVSSYFYDSEGKLIKKKFNDTNSKYEYDNEGRLIKEIENNGYTTNISYNKNKVILREYQNGELTRGAELTVNSKGKVIKFIPTIPNKLKVIYPNEGVEYDPRGNIIKIVSISNDKNNRKYEYKYEYDENPNPYYYAYRELYKSTYYLDFIDGVGNYFYKGFCPNNMTNYEEGTIYFKYIYDEDGYPIQRIRDGKSKTNFEY